MAARKERVLEPFQHRYLHPTLYSASLLLTVLFDACTQVGSAANVSRTMADPAGPVEESVPVAMGMAPPAGAAALPSATASVVAAAPAKAESVRAVPAPLPGVVPVRLMFLPGSGSAVGATLDGLRKEARRLGEVEYEKGPGVRVQQERLEVQTPEAALALEKKIKKSQSAYVSRFGAKEYERLLEEAVTAMDASLLKKRAFNAGMKQDNADMREQIEALDAAVSGGVSSIRMRMRKTEPPEEESPAATSTITEAAANGVDANTS